MATCMHCQSRKGKRPCPALGGPLCSPCCGHDRQVRIPCPDSCAYLVEGTAYQRDRRAERGFSRGRAYLQERVHVFGKDEERFAFTIGIEEVLHRYRDARRTTRDRDCRAAVADLRAELGGLALPDPCPRELREAARREARALAQHIPGLTRHDRRQCLEVILDSIDSHAAENLDGQAYLDFIAAYFHEVASGPSPERASREDSDGPRRTRSGLILP